MKKRNGFTLIELLSLIAIIVLLVSIFLPSLQNIQRQANSVACRSNIWNDMSFSPIELVLVSSDNISGKLTIVGKFLVWEQIPENPDLYGSYGSNLWICAIRCVADTCWIAHNCINQPEDNAKEIVLSSLLNKIEQKQSAR
jgi:hypothetical protein